MLRFINICLVLGLVALAYVIYEVKYEARGLDEEIAVLKKNIDAERDSVAVLRAEWSLLNRPERIERLAQKYLKLQAARPDQLAALDTLSDADFHRARTAVAAAQPGSDTSSKPGTAKAVVAKSGIAKSVIAKSVIAKASAPNPDDTAPATTASIKKTPPVVQPVAILPAPASPAKPRAPITASVAE